MKIMIFFFCGLFDVILGVLGGRLGVVFGVLGDSGGV